MMRKILLVVGITVLGSSLHAQQAVAAVQAKPVAGITLALRNVTLKEALTQITQQAGLKIVLNQSFAPLSRNVSVDLHNVSLAAALAEVMKGTGALARLAPDGQTVVVERVSNGSKRGQGVVGGKVTDAKSGKGIAGASITIDSDRGVAAGADGVYRIDGVNAGVHTVTVRFVGYAKQTKQVTVGEGATVIADFKMEPSANVLDQVIVTGTVVSTELKAVPNAITVVTAKQIEERGITRIDQLFRGDIPGLFAQNQGSSPTGLREEVTMYSRGVTSLSQSDPQTSALTFFTNPIKTYVDGVELADSKYLSQIDPRSIERIEILTGPQASTIYGSNAINGAMQIFTKRGATSRPQVNLNLLSGWVENNFSNARTPQHDLSMQLSGLEGRLSYNTGGSWSYVGPWTPAKQTSRFGGFGGAKIEIPTSLGAVTSDMTFRRSTMQNRVRGSAGQAVTNNRESGLFQGIFTGLSQPTTYTFNGQTFGVTLNYAPLTWWSHEVGLGRDASDADNVRTARGYASVSDTLLLISRAHVDRRSLRYSTVLRFPVTQFAQAVVTGGADNWQSLISTWEAESQSTVGTLTGTPRVTRKPGHNAGGFMQAQVSIKDQLFLTYGLRAEWNPDYGEDAEPNYAPRYGIAYTREMGMLTAKLRGSYGRSTRPPQSTLKVGQKATETLSSFLLPLFLPYYGSIDGRLANPDLGPEYQQGGEGGIELYFGSRASLVVTRYNQTVDGLIAQPTVDSVRSSTACAATSTCTYHSSDAAGYGYWWQSQYINVADIRNQGWELQGSISMGPLTTRGTYSWTKSRTIGVNPKFRPFFTPSSYPQYQSGATFKYLPEHTWAFGISYARAATTVGLNLTGTGQIINNQDDFFLNNLLSNIRLPQNRMNIGLAFGGYTNFSRGYALADMTASHRFMPRVEGVLQIQNMIDKYRNDYDAQYAALGRQLKAGLRMKM